MSSVDCQLLIVNYQLSSVNCQHPHKHHHHLHHQYKHHYVDVCYLHTEYALYRHSHIYTYLYFTICISIYKHIYIQYIHFIINILAWICMLICIHLYRYVYMYISSARPFAQSDQSSLSLPPAPGGGRGGPLCILPSRQWGPVAIYTGQILIPAVQSSPSVAGASACTGKETSALPISRPALCTLVH